MFVSWVAYVLNILSGYTNDRGSIVKIMVMQVLADVACRNPQLLTKVKRCIEKLIVIGTPAMKARGKKLLAKPARPRPTSAIKRAAYGRRLPWALGTATSTHCPHCHETDLHLSASPHAHALDPARSGTDSHLPFRRTFGQPRCRSRLPVR